MSETIYMHPDGYEIEVKTIEGGGFHIIVTGPDETVTVPIGPVLMQQLAADLARLSSHPV